MKTKTTTAGKLSVKTSIKAGSSTNMTCRTCTYCGRGGGVR